MIPKIIHLCWLSGDAFPPLIKDCLMTFSEKLDGYTVWLWGKLPADVSCLGNIEVVEKHFGVDSFTWTKEAFKAKKYAFAADYIRLYALYHYGGIYLDADVIVYKRFDELLDLPYFIGCDQIRGFEAAVIGAVKGCQWVKDILDSYQDRHFIKPDGLYDQMELPVRFHHELVKRNYRFIKILRIRELVNYNMADDMVHRMMYVFDSDFFNSRDAVRVRKTPKSFTAHNYAGSWNVTCSSHVSVLREIKDRLPYCVLKIIYTVGQATWARNKYAWFQIPFGQ